jgi:hypothetical protein
MAHLSAREHLVALQRTAMKQEKKLFQTEGGYRDSCFRVASTQSFRVSHAAGMRRKRAAPNGLQPTAD